MTRPQERKPTQQTLADLRPNMPIWCMFGHQASSDGALRFRSHLVCA